jgi:hypothetical protein
MGAREMLRRAAIENPSLQWLVIGDAVFATSDFFFHDGDDRPVALVEDDHNGVGHWVFLERAEIERRHAMICGGTCDETKCRHAFKTPVRAPS